MATLTTTIKLSSTDITTDALTVEIVKALTVTDPAVNLGRLNAVTTGPTNILTTATSAVTYCYLKNMDSSNTVVVEDDASNAFSDLGPGEWMFFPLKGATGLEVQASGGNCVVEYGFWTKSVG